MVHYIKGNLLDSDCHFICHQVNCQGKMNSGVAKSIREKWPKVYENYNKWFMSHDAWAHAHSNVEYQYTAAHSMLGKIQIVALYEKYDLLQAANHQYVINMAAQNSYGYDGQRYTSYDAFWLCLGEIRRTVPKGDTIAFPHKIGCCRGGANWEVIRTMIEEALGEEYEVYIYEYEGE